MARVSIEGGHHLVADVQGLDKLWAFKSRLTFPIAHVSGATTDPGSSGSRPRGGEQPARTFPA